MPPRRPAKTRFARQQKLLPRKEKEGTYAMEWGGKMKGRNAHGDTGNMTRRATGHTQPPDAERNGFAAMRRGESRIRQ